MTKDQIKIACAKLDGWDAMPSNPPRPLGFGAANEKPEWWFTHQLPSYTSSYDAIIPLIQKQFKDDNISISEWYYNLQVATGLVTRHELSIKPAPLQLCEALLRATNNYKEKK